jgi:hypothetical protein
MYRGGFMVRLGLGMCALAFAVMLLIPVPMARVSKTLATPRAVLVSIRPEGRVGAPVVDHSPLTLAGDTHVEVPAPQRFEGLSEVSSFGATVEEPAAPLVYRISAPRAALRAGPDLRERALARLNIGQTVEVMTAYDHQWMFIRLPDGQTEGYVNKSDIEAAE